MSVGRALRHGVDAYVAAGAGAVLDHDLLPEPLGQPRRDGARHQVGAAARRKGNDETDGFCGVGLRENCRYEKNTDQKKKTPAHHPSPMVLLSTPTLSTSISTVSPGFIQTGGVRLAPTPPGVPVTITSPAASGVKAEMYSMRRGNLKIIIPVSACCMRSPFSRHDRVSVVCGGISSAVTLHGPKPPVAAKFLPAVRSPVWRCQSRTEPSL